MQKSTDCRGLVARSGKMAVFIAYLKVLADYTGDYVSGNKHRLSAHLNQQKQNTK